MTRHRVAPKQGEHALTMILIKRLRRIPAIFDSTLIFFLYKLNVRYRRLERPDLHHLACICGGGEIRIIRRMKACWNRALGTGHGN